MSRKIEGSNMIDETIIGSNSNYLDKISENHYRLNLRDSDFYLNLERINADIMKVEIVKQLPDKFELYATTNIIKIEDLQKEIRKKSGIIRETLDQLVDTGKIGITYDEIKLDLYKTTGLLMETWYDTTFSPNNENNTYNIEWGTEIQQKLQPFGLHENKQTILTELFWAKVKGAQTPKPFVVMSIKGREDREKREEISIYRDNGKYSFNEDITLPKYTEKWLLENTTVKKIIEFDGNIKIVANEILNQILDAIDEKLWIENIGHKKTLAYWLFGTYFYDIFDCYPIAYNYGTRGTGKTRAGAITEEIAYHGNMDLDVTKADLFRTKGELKPTMIIDENEEMSKRQAGQRENILNGSYSKRGGKPSRRRRVEQENTVVYVRDNWDIYSPTMLCSINPIFSEATLSRTLVFTMFQANRNYSPTRENEFKDIRQLLYLCRFKAWSEIKEIYDSIKLDPIKGFEARESEIWSPIFAIMEYLGRKEHDYSHLMTFARQNNQYKRTQDKIDGRRYNIVKSIAFILNGPNWKREQDGNVEILLKDITEKVNLLEGNTGRDQVRGKAISSDLQKFRFTVKTTEPSLHPILRTTTYKINLILFQEECNMLFGMTPEEIATMDIDQDVSYEKVDWLQNN